MFVVKSLLFISTMVLAGYGPGTSFVDGNVVASLSQVEKQIAAKANPAVGKYVCYDLTLVLGAGGYRYGYKYMESFTLMPQGRYLREASGAEGRFRYDALAKVIRFIDGPYAAVKREGKYEAQGKSASSRIESGEGLADGKKAVPNIVMHKRDDKSGDLDWYCSLEEQ